MYFFSQTVINRWNKLPQEDVDAQSINCFKNRLGERRTQQMDFFKDLQSTSPIGCKKGQTRTCASRWKRLCQVQPHQVKGKGSPYSITERRVPELILVLGSQPAGDVSHKPGGRLSLVSATPAVTPTTLKRAATYFAAWLNRGTMGVNSLPKTVTGQRRGCDLNPGPSVPESSTLTTRLPSRTRRYR